MTKLEKKIEDAIATIGHDPWPTCESQESHLAFLEQYVSYMDDYIEQLEAALQEKGIKIDWELEYEKQMLEAVGA